MWSDICVWCDAPRGLSSSDDVDGEKERRKNQAQDHFCFVWRDFGFLQHLGIYPGLEDHQRWKRFCICDCPQVITPFLSSHDERTRQAGPLIVEWSQIHTPATNIFGLATFEHAGKSKILVATRYELLVVEACEDANGGGIRFRSFSFPTPHNNRKALYFPSTPAKFSLSHLSKEILAINSYTRGPEKAPTIAAVFAAPVRHPALAHPTFLLFPHAQESACRMGKPRLSSTGSSLMHLHL